MLKAHGAAGRGWHVNSVGDCARHPRAALAMRDRSTLPRASRRACAADRRLRRCRPARAAAAARPLARAGADLVARARAARCARWARCRCWATWTCRPRWAGWRGLADAVLHLAPPPGAGRTATRARAHLLQRAGARRAACSGWSTPAPAASTATAAGARIDETAPLRPATDAPGAASMPSAQVRWFGRRTGARVTCCAFPASTRPTAPGGHPRERLLRGTPVLARRGRCLHQPHPCRRPGARLRRRAAARRAAARATRQRRQRAEDGRLLRPGRRPVRPAAPAARHARAGGAALVAAAAELHERIAAPGQPRLKRELRLAPALPDGRRGIDRGRGRAHPVAPRAMKTRCLLYADPLPTREFAAAIRRIRSPDPELIDNLPESAAADWSDVEAVLGWRFAAGALQRLPRLRWVCSIGAGVEKLLVPGLPDAVQVSSLSSILEQDRAIAQYVAMMALRHARGLARYRDSSRRDRFMGSPSRRALATPRRRARHGCGGQRGGRSARSYRLSGAGLPAAAAQPACAMCWPTSDIVVCALPLTQAPEAS